MISLLQAFFYTISLRINAICKVFDNPKSLLTSPFTLYQISPIWESVRTGLASGILIKYNEANEAIVMKHKEYSYINKEFIGNLPWVTDCDFSFIKTLPFAIKEKYFKDETIIHQEDINQFVFYIEKGRVKYSVLGSDGREKTVAIILEGNIFGEISSWDGFLSPCSVIAVTDEVIVYRVDNAKIFCEKPEYIKEFIDNLVKKNRMLISEIVAFNMKDTITRLATCILNLAKKFGVKSNTGSTKILVRFTHQQMGDLMGVSRVTVTNILNRMRKEEIIDFDSGYLVIKDEEKLKSIVLM